jgi:guanine nucleotide-binding protein subunit alpha
VYFNVVRNVKRILQALELAIGPGANGGHGSGAADTTGKDDEMDTTADNVAGPSSSSAYVGSPPGESSTRQQVEADKELLALALSAAARTQLATLKLRLSPLVTTEATLADRLSGGVQVSAVAKRRGGGVYVRSGWQKNSSEDAAPGSKAAGKRRRVEDDGHLSENGLANGSDHMEDELEKIARMLHNCREDLKVLWGHSFVKFLIEKRKLRLQESAEQ